MRKVSIEYLTAKCRNCGHLLTTNEVWKEYNAHKCSGQEAQPGITYTLGEKK